MMSLTVAVSPWQGENESAAPAGRALGPHATTVGLHDRLHDEQAEPKPSTIVFLRLEEPIEDLGQLIRRNAFPGVRHRDPDLLGPRFDANGDPAAFWRELQ